MVLLLQWIEQACVTIETVRTEEVGTVSPLITAFLSHCIKKMSRSLHSDKELCLMDSETKASTLTVRSDKYSGGRIHQQVLLARFHTKPIYLIMLLR